MSRWTKPQMPYADWRGLAADAALACQGEMSPRDEQMFRAWCCAHMDFVWVSLYFAATSRKLSPERLEELGPDPRT